MGAYRLGLIKKTSDVVYDVTKIVATLAIFSVTVPVVAVVAIVGRITGRKISSQECAVDTDKDDSKAQGGIDEDK